MTFTQLRQYLQDYLETNDSGVIGNIPNFMALALARISTELRGSVLEVSLVVADQPAQPLPAGFLAATLLQRNTFISTYVAPARFYELSAENPQGEYFYTLQSGQLKLWPTPQPTDVITLSYYVAGSEAISQSLPHLLLHAAAMEAEMYQGNTGDAQLEQQLFSQDISRSDGWDIQSGPISLGGAR
jgi:hypothetical protein